MANLHEPMWIAHSDTPHVTQSTWHHRFLPPAKGRAEQGPTIQWHVCQGPSVAFSRRLLGSHRTCTALPKVCDLGIVSKNGFSPI